jgi:hypothetical protein
MTGRLIRWLSRAQPIPPPSLNSRPRDLLHTTCCNCWYFRDWWCTMTSTITGSRLRLA